MIKEIPFQKKEGQIEEAGRVVQHWIEQYEKLYQDENFHEKF